MYRRVASRKYNTKRSGYGPSHGCSIERVYISTKSYIHALRVLSQEVIFCVGVEEVNGGQAYNSFVTIRLRLCNSTHKHHSFESCPFLSEFKHLNRRIVNSRMCIVNTVNSHVIHLVFHLPAANLRSDEFILNISNR